MAITLPSKPRYGEACNGCGLCCALSLCVAGEMLFPVASAPCPALKLTPDGSRTYCAAVRAETEGGLPPIIREAQGIGMGCSMED